MDSRKYAGKYIAAVYVAAVCPQYIACVKCFSRHIEFQASINSSFSCTRRLSNRDSTGDKLYNFHLKQLAKEYLQKVAMQTRMFHFGRAASV